MFVQVDLVKAITVLFAERSQQKGWCDYRTLRPCEEHYALMEEFLFWVAVLHRWVLGTQQSKEECLAMFWSPMRAHQGSMGGSQVLLQSLARRQFKPSGFWLNKSVCTHVPIDAGCTPLLMS
jgi:hypothetical protein